MISSELSGNHGEDDRAPGNGGNYTALHDDLSGSFSVSVLVAVTNFHGRGCSCSSRAVLGGIWNNVKSGIFAIRVLQTAFSVDFAFVLLFVELFCGLSITRAVSGCVCGFFINTHIGGLGKAEKGQQGVGFHF